MSRTSARQSIEKVDSTHEIKVHPHADRRRESAREVAAADARLVKAVASGDEQAFSELYDRYAAVVFAVCRRVLPDANDAEDAVIDTFWEIWRRSDRFDASRGQFITYLLMLARSRAIDRRRSKTAGASAISAGEGVQDIEPSAAGNKSKPPPPEHASLLAERQESVQKAMASLSDTHREAVELSFFCGLSHRQIADCLHQPLGTVKTKVRQGLIQLRDRLRTIDGDLSL